MHNTPVVRRVRSRRARPQLKMAKMHPHIVEKWKARAIEGTTICLSSTTSVYNGRHPWATKNCPDAGNVVAGQGEERTNTYSYTFLLGTLDSQAKTQSSHRWELTSPAQKVAVHSRETAGNMALSSGPSTGNLTRAGASMPTKGR